MPFINPDQIIIPADRYRQDFSCVQQRADDIKKIGQTHPVLLRKKKDGEYPDDPRDLVLLDGECRIRARKLLQQEVWYTTNAEGQLMVDTELQHRLVEMMSNVSRQDMSVLEKSRAMDDIDRLMKEAYGQKGQNTSREADQEGHSTEDTAKMLGYKNRRTIITAKMITKAATTMPELATATSMSEAVKMIQTKTRLEAQEELARRNVSKSQGPIKDPQEYFNQRIILGDCLSSMKTLNPGIASIFLTDIPYGIDYKPEGDCLDKSENKDTVKKMLGFYEDKPAEIIPLVESVIQQMSRTGRPNCFAYMFCAFRHWNHLVGVFQENGFDVYNKPITWIRGSFSSGKLHSGVCRLPAKWPASSSDCILFASRGTASLAKQGQPDVIFCSPISNQEKIHVVQRPLSLLTELISRVFHPDTKGLLIDPFAGSGSSLAAAMQFEGLSYFGYELDPENRKRAVSYLINEYDRMINPQPKTEIEDLEV